MSVYAFTRLICVFIWIVIVLVLVLVLALHNCVYVSAVCAAHMYKIHNSFDEFTYTKRQCQ